MPLDQFSFFENQPVKKPITVLGVPLDVGKDATGTDTAPQYLRQEGLTRMLQGLQVEFKDLGDVVVPKRAAIAMGDKQAKFVEPISKVLGQVAATIQKEVSAGHLTLVLGGDHSIAIGAISGAALATEGELGLIYIDAHPDANTDKTTLSGNVHGMVTTALTGFGHPALTSIGSSKQKIKPENLIFIGIKDFDQAEIDWIRREKIISFTPIDLERFGLNPVCQAIASLQKRVKHIWVSFDIDSVDRQFAPATPMSTSGGLTFREIQAISKYIGKTCALLGLDIVECMPIGDEQKKTAAMAITFAANLLGAEYSWYTAYMEEEERKQQGRK